MDGSAQEGSYLLEPTLCTAAAAGRYVDAVAQVSQKLCAKGYYQPNTAQTSCLQSGQGFYVATSGSSSRSTCAKGYRCPNNVNTAQTACLKGTYQPQTQKTTCLNSGYGWYVPTTASASRTACAVGYYCPEVSNPAQIACAKAYYQPNTKQTSCLQSEKGYYVDTAASSSRTICEPGTYCPLDANEIYTDCPVGHYQDLSGQSACVVCEIGYYAPDPGHVLCSHCEPGKFQHLTGQPDCLFCRDDNSVLYPDVEFVPNSATYFVGEAQCYACPPNSIAETVSMHPSDHQYDEKRDEYVGHTYCECAKGYVADPATLDTSKWATMYSGVDVVNGLRCVPCAQTYYKDWVENATVCHRCPASLGTTAGEASTSLSDCFCIDGTWGDDRCCSTCAPGAQPASSPPLSLGNVDTVFDDVCAACPDRAVGTIVRDATCAVVSCEPGMQLVDGECVLCDRIRYCRDGQAATCAPTLLDTRELLRAPLQRGADSARLCRCGPGMKTGSDGSCNFCSQLSAAPDYNLNFRSALYPAMATMPQAEFTFDCLVECSEGWTGRWCLQECNAVPTCLKTQRAVPCTMPWSAYCAACENYVPALSDREAGTPAALDPLASADFERSDTLAHPLLAVGGTQRSGSVPASQAMADTPAASESRSSEGARGSQGWLLMQAGDSITPRVEPGARVLLRLFLALADPAQTVARVRFGDSPSGVGGAEAVSTGSFSWEEVFMEWRREGMTAMDTIFVDEVLVLHALVPPRVTRASTECDAGWVRSGGSCVPCSSNYACDGQGSARPCLSGTHAPPGSAQCICDPGFRHSPTATSVECARCPPGEDCSRGYSAGRLVAWQASEPDWNARRPLACGPLMCCAVSMTAPAQGLAAAPTLRCWGDNAHRRLGAPAAEVNAQTRFFRNARHVANLAAPPIAVAVTQRDDVALNTHLSCALLEDGVAQCWGQLLVGGELTACAPPDWGSEANDATARDGTCSFRRAGDPVLEVRTSSATACARFASNRLHCIGERHWASDATAASTNPLSVHDAGSSGGFATSVGGFALADGFLCFAPVDGSRLRCKYAGGSWFNAVAQNAFASGCKHVAAANNSLAASCCSTSSSCGLLEWTTSSSTAAHPFTSASSGLYTQSRATAPLGQLEVGSGSICVLSSASAVQCKRFSSNYGRYTGMAWSPVSFLPTLTASLVTMFSASAHVESFTAAGGALCAVHRRAASAGRELQGVYSDVKCVGDGFSAMLGTESCANVAPQGGVVLPNLTIAALGHPRGWELFGTATGNVLSERAAFAHELELQRAEDGGDAWVHAVANVACKADAGVCRVLLVRNLDPGCALFTASSTVAQVEEATLGDTVFVDQLVNPGASASLGGYVLAEAGDVLSVALMPTEGEAAPAQLTVTGLFATEAGSACRFRCPRGDTQRNEECTGCEGTCALGEYRSGCDAGRLRSAVRCLPCTDGTFEAKPDDPFAQYDATSSVECAWRCMDGYFWTGTACQLARTEPCPVGQFLQPPGRAFDAVCKTCAAQGTAADLDFTTNGNGLLTGCAAQCRARLWAAPFGCAACETRACGVGGQRFTSAYMTTGLCTPTQQSVCAACPTDRPGVSLTSSGVEHCAFSCEAGTFKRAECGVWNEHDMLRHSELLGPNALSVVEADTAAQSVALLGTLALDAHVDAQDAVVDVVVRFEGEVRVHPEKHACSAAVLMEGVFIGANAVPINSELTFAPLVSSLSHEPQWQTVDLRWHVPVGTLLGGALHTASALAFTVRAEGRNGCLVQLRANSLRAQTHVRCGTKAYECASCVDEGAAVFPEQPLRPGNASYVPSVDCAWECNEEYELQADNTCLFCPLLQCGIGRYMVACGLCAPCDRNESNIVYTSTGVRGDPASCTAECATGFFRDEETGLCAACTNFTAMNLTCEEGEFLRACSPARDATCMPCSSCLPGQRVAVNCSEHADAVCEACDAPSTVGDADVVVVPLPRDAEWAQPVFDPVTSVLVPPAECAWICTNPEHIRDDILHMCRPCEDSCPVGQYVVACTRETNYRGCLPCDVPENAVATSPGRALPDSCAWECMDGFLLTAMRDALGVVQRFACVRVEAPPPPPPTPTCDRTQSDCAVGQVLQDAPLANCSCAACPSLPNATLNIAQFVETDNVAPCTWVCIAPFVREKGVCQRLSRPPGASQGGYGGTTSVRGRELAGTYLVASTAPFLLAAPLLTVWLARAVR